MAFFDKLNDLAKNIGDKTTDAIETTKLNSKITTEKSAAGEDLKKIGAFYYAKFAAGEEIEPSLLERFQSAAAHYAAAAEAQAEIDRIRAENEAAKAAAATTRRSHRRWASRTAAPRIFTPAPAAARLTRQAPVSAPPAAPGWSHPRPRSRSSAPAAAAPSPPTHGSATSAEPD